MAHRNGSSLVQLTHWGRVTHICVNKLIIIGSDNGLSPGRRQAIIWTNAGILLIGPLGTNLSEILVGIQTISFRKMHLKMSSAFKRPFRLGLNELMAYRLCDAKALHESILIVNWAFRNKRRWIWINVNYFSLRKLIKKYRLRNIGHFVTISMC